MRLIEAGRMGRGRALNLGARSGRGKYLAIQDADDLSHPRRLEIQRIAIERSPGWGILGTGQHLLDGSAEPGWSAFPAAHLPPVRDVTSRVLYSNPLSHTSLFMRREIFEKVGGYDESRRNLYDWDLLVRSSVSGFRLGRLALPLVAHRVHKGQFFERSRRWDYVRACYSLQREARRSLNRHWLTEPVFLGLLAYRLLPPSLRIGWRRAIHV